VYSRNIQASQNSPIGTASCLAGFRFALYITYCYIRELPFKQYLPSLYKDKISILLMARALENLTSNLAAELPVS
jgi:hypothetical protein